MLAQRDRMPVQRLVMRVDVVGVHRLLPGDEVDLAVDDHAPIARQAHHHVGPLRAAVLVGHRLLALVVHAVLQAGAAQHAFEHELAPVAAHLGIALERAGERMRLRGHVLVEPAQLAQRADQRCALLRFLAVNGIDALAELVELCRERLEQRLDVGLGLHRRAAHVLLELLAALLEDLARHLREARGQFCLRVLDEGAHLALGAPRVLEVGLRLRERLAGALGLGLLRGLRVAQRRDFGPARIEFAHRARMRGLLAGELVAQAIGDRAHRFDVLRGLTRAVQRRLRAAQRLGVVARARLGGGEVEGEAVALGLQRGQARILATPLQVPEGEADEREGKAGEGEDGEGERGHGGLLRPDAGPQ